MSNEFSSPSNGPDKEPKPDLLTHDSFLRRLGLPPDFFDPKEPGTELTAEDWKKLGAFVRCELPLPEHNVIGRLVDAKHTWRRAWRESVVHQMYERTSEFLSQGAREQALSLAEGAYQFAWRHFGEDHILVGQCQEHLKAIRDLIEKGEETKDSK